MSTIQATAVCKDNQAILLMGPAGSGKSLLALTLIEQGWVLISDDMVVLSAQNSQILVSNPDKMHGCIEARGLGILSGLPTQNNVPVFAIIVLEPNPTERMPFKQKYLEISGCYVPLFHMWQEEKYLLILVLNAVKIALGQLKLLQTEAKNA